MKAKSRGGRLLWAAMALTVVIGLSLRIQIEGPTRSSAQGNPTQTLAPAPASDLATDAATPWRSRTETWETPTVATPEITPLPTATP